MKVVFNSRKKRYHGFHWAWGFILIAIASAVMAAIAKPEEKKYRIDVTLNEANALLYCLDKSNAEHTTVGALSKLITDQVNAQIKTEDSLNKKKTLSASGSVNDSTNKKPKQ